jgi:hypothetical protein
VGVEPGEEGEWAWYLVRRVWGVVPGEEGERAWYLVRRVSGRGTW